MKVSEWLERATFGGLLAAICLAPWPFGSVENYAVDALGLLLLPLLAALTLKLAMEGRFEVRLGAVHYALFCFVLIGLFQLVRMPWVVHSFTGGLAGFSTALPIPDGRTISLDPAATRRATVKLAILVGYFLIATQCFATKHRLGVAVHVLVLLGVAVALTGILHQLTFNNKILWIRPSEFAGGSFGPFVNRNHFAGFMELLFPLPLAMIFFRGAGRERWVLYGFCGLAMACAGIYSLSRGGLLSIGAEVVLLPVLVEFLNRRRRQARNRESSKGRKSSSWFATAGVIVLIVAAIGLGVAWIGAEPLVSRWAGTRTELLESHTTPQSRPQTWWIALKIFSRNPILGVGLGAFPRAYPMFDESPGVYYVSEAHNDYLQVLSDSGAVGAVTGICFIAFLGIRAKRALFSPRAADRAAVLGATVGICGVLVHSLVDFNLQITSNGLVFLTLAAVIVSADRRRRGLPIEPMEPGAPETAAKLVKAVIVK